MEGEKELYIRFAVVAFVLFVDHACCTSAVYGYGILDFRTWSRNILSHALYRPYACLHVLMHFLCIVHHSNVLFRNCNSSTRLASRSRSSSVMCTFILIFLPVSTLRFSRRSRDFRDLLDGLFDRERCRFFLSFSRLLLLFSLRLSFLPARRGDFERDRRE